MAEVTEHEWIGISSLLFVVIILLTLFIGTMLEVHHISIIGEASASIILGLGVGILISFFPYSELDTFEFHPQFFFYILLPPIIFEAGFSLRRKQFFKNFGAIIMFAVVGTIVSTLVICFGLYLLAHYDIVPFPSLIECLLFGTLLSATDTAGILAVLGKKELNINPTLYSIMFGESVLNDAVCIILFEILNNLKENTSSSAAANVGAIIGNFFTMFIGSFSVGVGVGLLCSFLVKKGKKIINSDESTALQFSIILLFAYGSYFLGEVARLSGIVCIFFCGITMAHYAWHNLTVIGQSSCYHVFKAISKCSENFVYAYLGIAAALTVDPVVKTTPVLVWNINTIVFCTVLCALSRAMNIFPLTFILNLRRKPKLTYSQQAMMWFAGLRGAMAFALSLNMTTEHQGIIVSTVLCIVFLTTIPCGSLVEPLVIKLKLQNISTNNENESPRRPPANIDGKAPKMFIEVPDNEENQPNDVVSPTKKKRGRFTLRRPRIQYQGVHKLWNYYDTKYFQPWFGIDRPPNANANVNANANANVNANVNADLNSEIRNPNAATPSIQPDDEDYADHAVETIDRFWIHSRQRTLSESFHVDDEFLNELRNNNSVNADTNINQQAIEMNVVESNPNEESLIGNDNLESVKNIPNNNQNNNIENNQLQHGQ